MRYGRAHSGYESQHASGAQCGSQLPTAIYPHRALEKRKPEVKTSFGLCFEWIQKDYNWNCCKMHVKTVILGTKTFKISPNWCPKSMPNPWKVEVASRMRCWSGLGALTPSQATFFGNHLATIFDQNSIKWHPKRHVRIDAEKVLKIDAKRLPNLYSNGCQHLWIFKLFEKNMKSMKTSSRSDGSMVLQVQGT